MRRLSGFSLMEMMVVLLIVAVVAAASAPMINKKMMSNASERSPWVWTGENNVAFNLRGDGEKTVTIGAVNPPNGINPSLYIGGNNGIKLAFDDDNGGALGFITGNNNMAFGDVTNNLLQDRSGCTLWGVGASAGANNATAIGHRATANGNGAIAISSSPDNEMTSATTNAIAIGNSTTANGEGSIAIGSRAEAFKDNLPLAASIAIGYDAIASEGATAIGYNAGATGKYSMAIGHDAHAYKDRQIVIGKNYQDNLPYTVYIPGNLVVDGNVYLGRRTGSKVYMALPEGDTGTTTELNLMWHDGGNWVKKTGGYKYGSVPLSSDRRLKNVGKPFVAGLEEIKKLKVFNFTYKKDKTNTPQVGVMAQDLQKIFPNAVTKGDDGYLLIRKEEMFYAMVNAIKELANNFDVQGKKIKELEKQNADLIKRIEALEKKVK